jgi:UDP-glucose 4-epimerase
LKALADNTESFGGIYNIGSQRKISIYELAELVIKELNSTSKIKLIPYEEAYEAGFEDMMHRAPDTAKINMLIRWRPEHSLEKVIHDVANAMK